MADVPVRLQTRLDQVSQETVELLRDCLERAERGEIVAMAVAMLERNGSSVTKATASENAQALLGAVSLLQHRMLHNAMDASYKMGA